MGLGFEQSMIVVDGQAHPGTAVFLLVETDLAVAELSFSHFSPTARRAVVTAADPQNRIILELNAEPAAQEYARLAGIPESLLTPTEFARHPLLLRARAARPCPRHPRGDARGRLAAFVGDRGRQYPDRRPGHGHDARLCRGAGRAAAAAADGAGL